MKDVIEEHWIRTWSLMGTASGGDVIDDPEKLVVRAGLDHFPYNQVLRCTPLGDAERTIDSILELLSGREAAWALLPSSGPSDLPDRLMARGCSHYATATGMWAELDDVKGQDMPAEMRVERVGPDLLPSWVDLVLDQWHLSAEDRDALLRMQTAIGFDVVQRWLVFMDDVAVAKATTARYEQDVVGLYGVGTKPEARGRGIASLLTAHALRAARNDGARTAVLHSTPMAVDIYRKLGFIESCLIPVYALPKATADEDRMNSL